MKNKNGRKKEYYIHQIIREEQGQKPDETVTQTVVTNIRTTPSYAENVGYHLDPSRYDSLRTHKPKTPPVEVEEPIIEEPVEVEQEVEVSSPVVTPTSDDDYYSQMADQFMESNDETVISDVISIEESTEPEVVEPVKPAPVVAPKPTPAPTTPKPEVVAPRPRAMKKKKYVAPSLDLLNKGSGTSDKDVQLAEDQKAVINEVLKNYGIKAHVAKYIFGPTVIVYLIELETLSEDVKSIRKIEDNLAMYLACSNIRILTPIPNMKYAGIEIPRPVDNRSMVYLRDLISIREFTHTKYHLPVAVGMNNFGEKIYCDICDMPHGLCAGATKSGKSVSLNVIILSLLYHHSPDDVRLMLFDPKIVEFGKYSDIPHLAMPVITDQQYFEPAVIWLTDEMERRYQILNKYGAVELSELNEDLVSQGLQKIPYIVMIMDEFNDWFIDASTTVNDCITKLMQKARAAGIHIILATQRPSADVIKGAIKANITARFAFSVSSFADSSVILGQSAAEKLEGKGDMILRFPGRADMRLQGAFVSNKEIKSVVEYLRTNYEVDYIVTLEELQQSTVSRGPGNGSYDPNLGRNDELFKEICYIVVRTGNASVNSLQKAKGTSFNRMDRIFKDMEELGIVSGTQQGTKRRVLVNELELEDILNTL